MSKKKPKQNKTNGPHPCKGDEVWAMDRKVTTVTGLSGDAVICQNGWRITLGKDCLFSFKSGKL